MILAVCQSAPDLPIVCQDSLRGEGPMGGSMDCAGIASLVHSQRCLQETANDTCGNAARPISMLIVKVRLSSRAHFFGSWDKMDRKRVKLYWRKLYASFFGDVKVWRDPSDLVGSVD